MRETAGCAAILATVAFLFGLPFSLFFTVDHWSERFLIALMPAAMTFIAAFGLMLRDRSDFVFSKNEIQQKLLKRITEPEKTLIEPLSFEEQILVETRCAIAKYFEVPPNRIRALDNLHQDLTFDKLAPSLQMFVVDSVLFNHVDCPESFWFGLDGLETVADLSKAIGEIVATQTNPNINEPE